MKNIKDIAKLWNISERQVRYLCERGQIIGAKKEGKEWLIRDNPQRLSKKEVLTNRVYELQKHLKDCRPLTEGEKAKLNELWSAQYTYNSNAIEGNTLTYQETTLVLQGITIDKKPLKDHLEVIGHKFAFEYISLISNEKVISSKIIKDVHSLLLANQMQENGIYRKIDVLIGGAVNKPTPPFLIEKSIEKLIKKYKKSKKEFFEKVALFHLKFEGIHPFIDGNGRCGRLILNLMLMQEGFLPIDIKYTDRLKYYDCFKEYFEKGNYKPMVKLIVDYETERLEGYLKSLSMC